MSGPGVGAGGELAALVPEFRGALARRGFAVRTIATHTRLVRDLDIWLLGQGLRADALNAQLVAEFLAARRAAGARGAVSRLVMTPLLDHLELLGVIRPGSCVEMPDPTEVLQRYRVYLRSERGLVPAGVSRYEHAARLFNDSLVTSGEVEWANLSGRDVTRFMLTECVGRGGSSARNLAAGVRSFLRFLHVEGLTAVGLAAAVPSVAGWQGRSLPIGFEHAQVLRLLECCDRGRSTGRRDFAILTVLARLGLRAAEVAGMRLDDLDWRAGELIVHGKGQRDERLPLPSDVGDAVVEYLRRDRRETECRAVFLRMLAPHEQLASTSISMIVFHACDRAGVPRGGAHRLRHSAATRMLAGGATLSEVGQALRQRTLRATSIYAKVDHGRLRQLARPWPGESS